MSQKRKRSDPTDGESQAQAPVHKKPFTSGRPHQKFRPRRQEQGGETGPRTASSGELRNKIRSLTRLLEHVESDPKNRMPANVRIERERELATAQHELAEKKAAVRRLERRNKLISKYHHVRFFDRQRAIRNLKKLRRELAALTRSQEDAAEVEKIEQQIYVTEVAQAYSVYYPLMKPYSSLYPRTKEEKKDSEEGTDGQQEVPEHYKPVKGDPEMWAAVERAMKEGTLDELRNREDSMALQRAKDHDLAKGKKKQKEKEKKRTRSTTQRQTSDATKAPRAQDDGDESDGGFFE